MNSCGSTYYQNYPLIAALVASNNNASKTTVKQPTKRSSVDGVRQAHSYGVVILQSFQISYGATPYSSWRASVVWTKTGIGLDTCWEEVLTTLPVNIMVLVVPEAGCWTYTQEMCVQFPVRAQWHNDCPFRVTTCSQMFRIAPTLQNKDHPSSAMFISDKTVRGNRRKLVRIVAYQRSSYVSDWCSQTAHCRRWYREAASETAQDGWSLTAGGYLHTSAEYLYITTTTFICHKQIRLEKNCRPQSRIEARTTVLPSLLTLTLTLHLDFQCLANYGHNPHTHNISKKVSWFKSYEQWKWNDRQH